MLVRFLSVTLLLTAAFQGAAQSPRPSKFTGSVVGPYSATVPKAKIVIEGGTQKWNLESDEHGEFQIDLPPGTYRFNIEAPHFSRAIFSDFCIGSGFKISYEFRLKLGECSDCEEIVQPINTEIPVPQPVTIFSDVPQVPDTKTRYLFYLHGYIVEAGNTRPTSPKFGVYEYEKILETFQQSGFAVISEARKKNPELEPYAAKVAEQIRQLLKAGVPPNHITVVGASQGSWITMLASTYLKNRDVNFVLIAACSADKGFLKTVNLHGNVLSIYEKSDLAQSCREYRADATGINDWKEIEVSTGLQHGFLYRPMKEWTEPTIAWAKR